MTFAEILKHLYFKYKKINSKKSQNVRKSDYPLGSGTNCVFALFFQNTALIAGGGKSRYWQKNGPTFEINYIHKNGNNLFQSIFLVHQIFSKIIIKLAGFNWGFHLIVQKTA